MHALISFLVLMLNSKIKVPLMILHTRNKLKMVVSDVWPIPFYSNSCKQRFQSDLRNLRPEGCGYVASKQSEDGNGTLVLYPIECAIELLD